MRLVELLDAAAAALVGGVAVRQPARNRTCCVDEHRPEAKEIVEPRSEAHYGE